MWLGELLGWPNGISEARAERCFDKLAGKNAMPADDNRGTEDRRAPQPLMNEQFADIPTPNPVRDIAVVVFALLVVYYGFKNL